jgi:hypothetical protein
MKREAIGAVTPSERSAMRNSAAPAPNGKRVISGVVTHAKLVAEIQARNPILARRHETAKPNAKAIRGAGAVDRQYRS